MAQHKIVKCTVDIGKGVKLSVGLNTKGNIKTEITQTVVRQIKREHIRQIKSGLIHGNCQKTVGLSSLISSDYKKKKLPMQIKTQAVS